MKSPDCPACGHPPKFLVGTTQAFCGNDECNWLAWNPQLTPAENLADAHSVELPEE
jgi:hypothetical protein